MSTHYHYYHTDIQMARRCSGDQLTMRTGSGGKKPLKRSLALVPGAGQIYPGMEEVTRGCLGEGVVTRRRLIKAESMSVDTTNIEKTPSKTWKRLLRKQRTMGEIDVAPNRMSFHSVVSRLRGHRNEEKNTRKASVGNWYPDLSQLHLSQSVNTGRTRNCNTGVSMEVEEELDTVMDISERDRVRGSSQDGGKINSVNQMSLNDHQRRIEDIFLGEKQPTGPGMQLRSGSVIQKSKFDNNENGHVKLTKRNSVQSGPISSRILDFLYLGSIEAAYNEPLLCKLKIHVLVDLSNLVASQVPAGKKSSCPCPCNKNHFRSRLNVGVDDIEWENISQHFDDINNFIEGARRSNKNVLVCSYHGNSRAATAVVQYIMRNFRLSLADAFELVQSRRPLISINSGFWRALQRLEKELFLESRLPFRNPQSDIRLQLGPPKTRDAWS